MNTKTEKQEEYQDTKGERIYELDGGEEHESEREKESGVKGGWKDVGHQKTVSREKNLVMTEYTRIQKRPPVTEAAAV